MASQVDMKTCKRNNYKCLLFADNPDHMALLKRIMRHDETKRRYLGCWHTEKDDHGAELIKGQGKKHCHLLIAFPNPRAWSSVCKMLKADERFLRPVGVHDSQMVTKKESLKRGYAYLVHANCPEKGLINPHELFGADWMRESAFEAINEALAKNISMSAAVFAVSQWVQSQGSKEITTVQLVKFLASSPYFKAQQSRLVYQLVNEHNDKIRAQKAKEKAMRERGFIDHTKFVDESEVIF